MLVRKATFSVVMLALVEKHVKTEILLRQTVMRMRIEEVYYLLSFTPCKCQTGCKNKRWACKKSDILCCDACFCTERCENRDTLETDNDED